jgi:hypothetical protein
MRFIVLIVFSLMTIAPASAQYALRPMGAVPLLDGCNGMSGNPECHPDGIYMGRSVAIPAQPGMQGTARHYRPGTQFYRRW